MDKEIGARIKEARKNMGFSREQVARKVGVSQQQIARYESGENRVSIGNLYAIGRVLHAPLSYFIEPISLE